MNTLGQGGEAVADEAMNGWVIAATLFAAGAFALGLLHEWRRLRSRPTWSWAVRQAQHANDSRRHRIELQLISDHPAYHVQVEGVSLHIDHDHHDHDHDRTEWPHLGIVDPRDDPLVIYAKETGATKAPRLDVTWMIPPMRRGNFLRQSIAMGPNAPKAAPRRLGMPAWRRRLRRLRRLSSRPADQLAGSIRSTWR